MIKIMVNESSSPPTIVYVEDNNGDAVLLQEALKEQGHETTLLIIEKGDHALHYFKVKESAKDLPPPHCILLDSHLPIVTGSELIAFIRGSAVFNDTPVYIFASEDDYVHIRDVVRVSRESFLKKPSRWEEFLELAQLLMKSAIAKKDETPAERASSAPEIPTSAALKTHPAK